MKTWQNRFLVLASLLVTVGASGADDKNIVIDSDLAARAEMLKVKMGTAWAGKTWNFKFGDYGIETSKMGKTTSKSEYGGLGSATRGKSQYEFSFVMGNKTTTSATVSAAVQDTSATRTSHDATDIILDRDEVLKYTNVLDATITTSNDKDEVWKLTLEYAEGSNVAARNDGILSNGSRTFFIVAATSAKDGKDSRTFPALGYEFIEDGVARCAVQYFGGGAFGANKSVIWLGTDLDPDMKLVLAAAMSSILQVKVKLN
jgi:hypothetical protein